MPRPSLAPASAPLPSRRGKRTWREKLADDKGLPKIGRLDPIAAARWGGDTLAIPAPREVDALMRRVPSGRIVTTSELRAAVAERHQVAVGCPTRQASFPGSPPTRPPKPPPPAKPRSRPTGAR